MSIASPLYQRQTPFAMSPVILSPLTVSDYCGLRGYVTPAVLHPEFSTQSLDRRR